MWSRSFRFRIKLIGSKNLPARFGPDSFTNVPHLDVLKLLHNIYSEKQGELTTDRTSPTEAGDKTLSLKKPMARFFFFFIIIFGLFIFYFNGLSHPWTL
jgi:hypothetical protein